jgi:hypothetical protein
VPLVRVAPGVLGAAKLLVEEEAALLILVSLLLLHQSLPDNLSSPVSA